MSNGQFRCCFYTKKFEETLAFYREGLGFLIADSWNRNPDDKGVVFQAASGMIEFLVMPKKKEPIFAWGKSKPQGMMIVIETGNIDEFYKRVKSKKLEIHEKIKNRKWGHRTFIIRDPNGVELYFYEEIK